MSVQHVPVAAAYKPKIVPTYLDISLIKHQFIREECTNTEAQVYGRLSFDAAHLTPIGDQQNGKCVTAGKTLSCQTSYEYDSCTKEIVRFTVWMQVFPMKLSIYSWETPSLASLTMADRDNIDGIPVLLSYQLSALIKDRIVILNFIRQKYSRFTSCENYIPE